MKNLILILLIGLLYSCGPKEPEYLDAAIYSCEDKTISTGSREVRIYLGDSTKYKVMEANDYYKLHFENCSTFQVYKTSYESFHGSNSSNPNSEYHHWDWYHLK